MRQILRLLLIVSSCSIVLPVFLLMPVRDQPIAQYEPVASEFLPGHTLPYDLSCESAYYSMDNSHLYCRAVQGIQEGNLYITFDVREKIIVRTTLLDPNKTIGELILAWGVPTGVSNLVLGKYVYWPGRYVFVASKVFSPGSPTGFLVYDNRANIEQLWTGFRNRRH